VGLHAPAMPVRLGLNRIKGLSQAAGERVVKARRQAAFVHAEDLARRAELDTQALEALAQADALRSLLAGPDSPSDRPGSAPRGHRHQAAWAVAGIDTRPPEMLRGTQVPEHPVWLSAPTVAEETLADYRSLGLSLKAHPLALLRSELDRYKVQPAAVLKTYPPGRLARASGLVTHRQRPPTAKGTLFITLEDDTGTVNVIVWSRLVETLRRPLLSANLLTVFGQWQCLPEAGEHQGGVAAHLIATQAIDHSHLLSGLVSRSRDFK